MRIELQMTQTRLFEQPFTDEFHGWNSEAHKVENVPGLLFWQQQPALTHSLFCVAHLCLWRDKDTGKDSCWEQSQSRETVLVEQKWLMSQTWAVTVKTKKKKEKLEEAAIFVG